MGLTMDAAWTPEERAIWLSLDPRFQPFVARLKARFPGARLVSGYRPTAYQELLYRHPELHPGTPAAPPGRSKHERQMACDFDLSALNQLAVAQFGQSVEALGLVWGGRFSPPDRGHVEAPFSVETLDAYRAILTWMPPE